MHEYIYLLCIVPSNLTSCPEFYVVTKTRGSQNGNPPPQTDSGSCPSFLLRVGRRNSFAIVGCLRIVRTRDRHFPRGITVDFSRSRQERRVVYIHTSMVDNENRTHDKPLQQRLQSYH